MEASTINGLPYVWEVGPGPFTATLTFRAGRMYEELRERGSTAIIESRVRAALRAQGLSVGSNAGAEAVAFFVSGEPDQVAAALARGCATLFELGDAHGPEFGHPQDASVPEAVEAPLAWAAHRLYGHTGIGRLGSPQVGPRQPERRVVAGVVARCFNVANAVLTLSGAPPDLSACVLPPGVQPAYPRSVPVGLPRPCLLRAPVAGATAVLDIAHDAAGIAFLGLVPALLEAGLARYGVHASVYDPGILVAADHLVMSYHVDCRPIECEAAVRVLHESLEDLVQAPPTAADLAELEAAYAARALDPGLLDVRLDEAAARLLADFGPEAVLDSRPPRTMPADVARVAARAAGSAVYVVPERFAPGVLDLADGTRWQPPSPPPVSPALRARGPGVEVIADDAGVTVLTGSQRPVTAWWSTVAGVECSGTRRALHLNDGRRVRVDLGQLAGGPALLTLLDRQTSGVAWDGDLTES